MPQLNHVTLKAPATSANMGPGFDVFGLALEYPTDKVTLALSPKSGVRILVTGVQAQTISTSPERNTAGLVANFMIREFDLKTGLTIQIDKGVWPSKGLGSSAASAAAVAVGLNEMFSLNLSLKQLVRLAAKGEVASAGSEHADNVSAAIYGDFVILRSIDPTDIISLRAPTNMGVSVAFAHMVTPPHKTAEARSVVPKMIPIKQLLQNVGNAAAMASGFATGNVDLIGESMLDAVVEPARTARIPGYLKVKENALKAGACGVTISGAGPAILAVINKRKADPVSVAEAMRQSFEASGFEATAFATNPGKGVSVLEN